MRRDGDNAHLMHSLERQFFRYVIRQIDYTEGKVEVAGKRKNNISVVLTKNESELVEQFCHNHNIEDGDVRKRQLKYYLKKWFWIYEYEVVIDIIPLRYLDLIPERVIDKLYTSCSINIEALK